MKRPTPGKRYRFDPVGLDIYDRNAYTPPPGAEVVAVKSPHGTPPSGTMGHTYVEWQEDGGKWVGPVLVLVNSLTPAGTPKGARRVVLKGDKLTVARTLADEGIPFAFVKQAGPNTVGDVGVQHLPTLRAALERHPELEGRFAALGD